MAVQIYQIVFILSLFFTVVQVTLPLLPETCAMPCKDIYDYEFLSKKNQQNLQYQELQTSFSDLGRWIWLKYRRAKWFNTCLRENVRNRKKAWKKFKAELGLASTK